MFSKGALALALASAIVRVAQCDTQADNDALVAKLRLASVATERIALLSDEQFKFDFFDPNAAATKGAGGRIVTANSETFPAVVGYGSAMAVGFLEPCSMNTPHTHPRATEIQISMNSTIRTGMITENGARFIMTELPPGSMTIFPMGSIHFQVNDGCDHALFVASFNSEDPGVLSIAQRFLGLPPDIVGATLGDLGVEQVAGLEAQIPDNVAIGTDACLQRCGLKRPTQLTTQRQSRVAGNALPTATSAWTSSTAATANDNTATAATSTLASTATSTAKPMNHLIKVGADGLTFSPSNITAAIGDIVTFEFHSKNHTVTQSSFANPCKKLAETSTTGQVGFASGFIPVSPNATTFPTFQITVNNTAPIWGYCGQQGPPVHCTSGMVFSINAVESGPNNFAAFLRNALDSGNATASAASSSSATAAASSSSSPGSAAAVNNLAAAQGDLSSTSSGSRFEFSPAIIALLVINGALVLGLLVLGGLYFRKYRAAARMAQQRVLYSSLGATGEPIFVTSHKPESFKRGAARAHGADEDDAAHGLTHGPYYDPHEAKDYQDPHEQYSA